MDALRYAEAVHQGRLNSIIWQNSPTNAKTKVQIELKSDPRGRPLPPSGSKTTGTRKERGGPEIRSHESVPDSSNASSSQQHQSERTTDTDLGDQTARTVIDVDVETEDYEASSSKGKRPLWDGLPEHNMPGPSSKRPRLFETLEPSNDALSDATFDVLLQAGVFG